eukprot:GHVS01025548.1.p1 GENE.GHVS01025548.1~~GHVS01025548.1.p1  ORF type:complete len:344 (+),score=71.36 GHVS01025548.1:79-1110(+)
MELCSQPTTTTTTDSFTRLKSVFLGRLEELQDLSCLRSVGGQANHNNQMKPQAEKLKQTLDNVDNTVRRLTHQLHTDTPLLEQIEATLGVTKQQCSNTNQLIAIASRILQHRFSPPTLACSVITTTNTSSSNNTLPSAIPTTPVHTAAADHRSVSMGISTTPSTQQDLSLSCLRYNDTTNAAVANGSTTNNNNSRPSTRSSPLSVSQPPAAKHQRISKVSVIPKVSTADLEGLPSHQRRGINCEKVNKAIDDIQTYLAKKLKIMFTPSSRLTPEQYRLQKLYKDQETEASKNFVTFSIADLKQFDFLRNDTTSRSILAALRSLGRLDTLTGAGHVMYGVAILR